jgi:hypothetical protein
MLLDIVRSFHTPLIVLPRGHPGSRRLRYVVSTGTLIRLACGIRRGTPPEQDILCTCPDLAGMVLEGIRKIYSREKYPLFPGNPTDSFSALVIKTLQYEE